MRRCLNVITHLSIHKKPKSMLQNTNAIYSSTNSEWRLERFVSHCLLLDINVIVHFWADAHNRLAQIFFKATQQLQQTKHPNKCAIRWIRRKCKHLTLDRHTRNWYARRQIQCTQGKPIHSFWRQTTQPSMYCAKFVIMWYFRCHLSCCWFIRMYKGRELGLRKYTKPFPIHRHCHW